MQKIALYLGEVLYPKDGRRLGENIL